MAVSLSPFAGAGWQFFTDNGVPLAGGKLYVYSAGTTSSAVTYTSSTGSIANTNPIIFNSAGRLANEIWLTTGLNYKFILKTSTDILVGSWDNIPAGTTDVADLQAALASSSGSSMIGFLQSGVDAEPTTVQSKLRETVSVLDFGADPTGSTDSTNAIQNALDYVAGNGGGSVYAPAGIYSVTQIKMRSHTKLYGDGWSSRLQLRNGANQDLIVLWDTNTEWTILSNLMIDGNRYNNSAGNAINYNNLGGTFTFFDANHIIENILIYTAAESGLKLSYDARESKVVNVFCTGANGDAFFIATTDSTFMNCTTGSAGLNGWYVAGQNNRFTACKAFGSGRLVTAGANNGAGWNIIASRIMLSSCESQDNGWHGYLFNGANHCAASSLIADSNGTNTNAVGIRLDDSDYCNIEISTFNRDAFTYQKYGLSLANNPIKNIITLTSKNQDGDIDSAVGNNQIVINNAILNGRISSNIGIKMDSSQWGATYTGLQMASPVSNGQGFGLSTVGYSDTGYLLRNAYNNGTNWKRVADGFSNQVILSEDDSIFFTKGGYGTAGSNITYSTTGQIDANGNWIMNVNGTAPSLSTNSQMTFELTSNTQLKIKVRGTDGTTRSATLTLT